MTIIFTRRLTDGERGPARVEEAEEDMAALLDAKFIWRWWWQSHKFRVHHGTDDSLDEVLVAVSHRADGGQLVVGEAAGQVQQVLQSSAVTDAAVLGLVDRRELWDWNQLFLGCWAGIKTVREALPLDLEFYRAS